MHGGQRGRESVFLVQQWQRWQPGTTLAQPLHDRAGGDGVAVTRACLHVLSYVTLHWMYCAAECLCSPLGAVLSPPDLCCRT